MPVSAGRWWLVFAAALVNDVVWALYVLATGAARPFLAAALAGAILALGAVSITSLALSGWYVVPAILGGMIGTFSVVGWHRWGKMMEKA